MDSSGFIGFVKTGWIFWKSVYKTNPQNESFENIKDSWSTIWKKSGFVNNKTKRIFLESGFAKQIHVFTNLLYDSRILKKISSEESSRPNK
jgi:hypothetical protein